MASPFQKAVKVKSILTESDKRRQQYITGENIFFLTLTLQQEQQLEQMKALMYKLLGEQFCVLLICIRIKLDELQPVFA